MKSRKDDILKRLRGRLEWVDRFEASHSGIAEELANDIIDLKAEIEWLESLDDIGDEIRVTRERAEMDND